MKNTALLVASLCFAAAIAMLVHICLEQAVALGEILSATKTSIN